MTRPQQELDIADPEVLGMRDRAQQFVRLYFRPRTPTQYYVEGVRKAGEFLHNNPRIHAPILVMFVFRALPVLTRSGTYFSNGNMQARQTTDGDNAEFFAQIPFENVFHDGPVPDIGKQQITHAKCAEVLAASPLRLAGSLEWIYLRSWAESATLQHLLGPNAAALWKERIKVHPGTDVFYRQWSHVIAVDLSVDGLTVELNPRQYGQKPLVEILVTDPSGAGSVFNWYGLVDFTNFRFNRKFDLGTYLIKINLENCLAYTAVHTVDDLPF